MSDCAPPRMPGVACPNCAGGEIYGSYFEEYDYYCVACDYMFGRTRAELPRLFPPNKPKQLAQLTRRNRG